MISCLCDYEIVKKPVLTGVHVGAECKRAVLHVKRKTEDLQVAG